MKKIITLLLGAALVVCAQAQYALKVMPPAAAEHAQFANHIRQTDVMNNLVLLFNKYVKVDREVPIIARSCGQANAFYYPTRREIVLCYDLMTESQALLSRQGLSGGDLASGVYAETAFILLHEVGHHLINEFELPVLGREEDAADKIAAYILLASGGDEVLLRAMSFFGNRQRGVFGQVLQGEHDYSAAHGLPQQRLANLACWGYGKSPENFVRAVQAAKLSTTRLRRCEGEYQAMQRDIDALLGDRLITRASVSTHANASGNNRLRWNALANDNQCVACHKPREYSIGPSLTAMAQRYQPDEIRAVLARKLASGGVGVWGGVPAPAMPNISDADVGELSRWVASHR